LIKFEPQNYLLKTTHRAKSPFELTTWVVSTNTQFGTVGFLSLSFSLFWSQIVTRRSHWWTDFDDLYVMSINQSINLFAHKKHKMTIKHKCKSKTY